MCGRTLGLSLLRSPVHSEPLTDEGYQAFAYALMPHEDSLFEGSIQEEAEDLNQPLPARPVPGLASGTWQLIAVKGIPAVLWALKRTRTAKISSCVFTCWPAVAAPSSCVRAGAVKARDR
jgi:alpha-mannosidase